MLQRLAAAHEALRGARPTGLSRPQLADATRALARLRSRIAALEADIASAVDGLDDKASDGADMMRGSGRRADLVRRCR